MTLDTRVFVLDPVDPHKTFRFCQELLGRPIRHQYWSDEQHHDNYRTLSNDPGQGLPAWLMLDYRPGAPLYTPEQSAAHESYCNVPGNPSYSANYPLCDGEHTYRRPCWLRISFDTAYGYRDERGYTCGDLHAEYVAKLGHWLDSQQVRWEFMNEFTGEIHGGPDRYQKLTELADGAFQATEWFRNTVLPAIQEMTEPQTR